MLIATLTITIRIPWAHSLKEKRSEVKKLVERTRNRFNASVVELAGQDLHQTIVLGVAVIAPNAALGDGMLEKILAFVEGNTQGEITDLCREYR